MNVIGVTSERLDGGGVVKIDVEEGFLKDGGVLSTGTGIDDGLGGTTRGRDEVAT